MADRLQALRCTSIYIRLTCMVADVSSAVAKLICKLQPSGLPGTMRFRSTAKVLAKCKPDYYRISECQDVTAAQQ